MLNPSTPLPEQDKELRETLAKNGFPHNNVEGDLLIEIIESYRKERELRARIAELEKFVNTTNRSLSVKKLRDRLSELKAQQEEE